LEIYAVDIKDRIDSGLTGVFYENYNAWVQRTMSIKVSPSQEFDFKAPVFRFSTSANLTKRGRKISKEPIATSSSASKTRHSQWQYYRVFIKNLVYYLFQVSPKLSTSDKVNPTP
jgi:hypothetical protein